MIVVKNAPAKFFEDKIIKNKTASNLLADKTLIVEVTKIIKGTKKGKGKASFVVFYTMKLEGREKKGVVLNKNDYTWHLFWCQVWQLINNE